MNIIEIINKKKNKIKLSKEEIDFFVKGFVDNSIETYQISSLLMAILLNGMDEEETSNLTTSMINSGGVVDLSSIEGIKSDKHSTGGVGDKVSIALVPLVVSCGAKIAKMSGKGLGHTGGTLDKLESIPGFKRELTEEEFLNSVRDKNLAIISQTNNLVPADKKLYALRDVTGTVDSIPLIASSIMSKKLASGADTILLDVKCGEGAFMKDLKSARELAESMVSIGKNHNKDTQAIISDMNEPLGFAIGNSLEVIEAIETLKGNGPKDFTELCLFEGSIILKQAKIVDDLEEGKRLLKESIENKSALKALKDLIKVQGGDERVLEDYSLLPSSKFKTDVKSPFDGYIESINPLEIGNMSSELGAGRKTVEDSINHGVGLVLNFKSGHKVSTKDTLLTIYHDEKLDESYEERLLNAFKFKKDFSNKKKLVYDHIF